MAASSALLCMEDTEECNAGLDAGKNETLCLQKNMKISKIRVNLHKFHTVH